MGGCFARHCKIYTHSKTSKMRTSSNDSESLSEPGLIGCFPLNFKSSVPSIVVTQSESLFAVEDQAALIGRQRQSPKYLMVPRRKRSKDSGKKKKKKKKKWKFRRTSLPTQNRFSAFINMIRSRSLDCGCKGPFGRISDRFTCTTRQRNKEISES